MDQFLEFSKYSPISILEFLAVSSLTAALSFICVRVYLSTLSKPMKKRDEHELILPVVIMGVVGSLVSLVVGANLAKAFAIFGVLSIVRYRPAIGKEHTVAFIFLAVSIGICVGTQYYTLAVLYTAFIVFLVFLINAMFNKSDMDEARQRPHRGKKKPSDKEKQVYINEV